MLTGTGRRRAAREEEEGEGEDGGEWRVESLEMAAKLGRKLRETLRTCLFFWACDKLREGPRVATHRLPVCPRHCDPNPIFRFQTFVRAISAPYN